MLYAYALAWAGGCIAYVPLLTALLPQRLTDLARTDDVRWLGVSATVGAITASLSNIGWGWLSDRMGHRLRFTAWGLAFFAITSLLIAMSRSPLEIVAAVALWQVALNLVLAPLAAFAADTVPDHQKGALGGLLAVGPGIAATSLLAISLLPDGFGAQLGAIVFTAAVMFLPLFLATRRAFALTKSRPSLKRP